MSNKTVFKIILNWEIEYKSTRATLAKPRSNLNVEETTVQGQEITGYRTSFKLLGLESNSALFMGSKSH